MKDVGEPVGQGRDGSKALFQNFDLKSHNHTPCHLFESIQIQHGGEQPSGEAATRAPSLSKCRSRLETSGGARNEFSGYANCQAEKGFSGDG